MERVYKVGDVAKSLGIGESTLRKWMAALQDAGYPWIVDENGWRQITEADLIPLRMFQEALTGRSTMEQAARQIVDEYRPNRGAVVSPDIEDKIERLENAVQELVKINMELVKELRERDNRRDMQLMETLREIQEVKLLQAAAQEENKKTGWFRSIFRRS